MFSSLPKQILKSFRLLYFYFRLILREPLFYWSLFLVLGEALCVWGSFFSYGSIVGLRFYFLFTAMLYAMFFFGIVFLLGRKWIPFFILLIVVSVIYSIGQFVSLYCYNIPLSGDLCMMILASSSDEMKNFIKNLCLKGYFWSGIIFIMIMFFVLYIFSSYTRSKISYNKKKFYRRIQYLGIIFILISVLLRIFGDNIFIKNPKINLLKELCLNYREYDSLVKFVKTERNIHVQSEYNTSKPPIICVVIGESATRDAWSLYGYERKTTPFMDSMQSQLIIYQAHAAATHTTTAMKYFLTKASPEKPAEYECTLPEVLNSGGYKTILLSNQSRWGVFDGPISMLFSKSHERFYIKELENQKQKIYDDALLPYFKKYLDKNKTEPLVIFLHLSGSHFPWRDTVPLEKQIYKQSELAVNETKESLRNSYDNSILFTDLLLNNIIIELKASKRPACLFYFSDHGDSPASGKERDASSKEMWNIPAIIWGTDEYWSDYSSLQRKLSNDDKNIRADKFFDLVLELTRLKIREIEIKKEK